MRKLIQSLFSKGWTYKDMMQAPKICNKDCGLFWVCKDRLEDIVFCTERKMKQEGITI